MFEKMIKHKYFFHITAVLVIIIVGIFFIVFSGTSN